MLSSNDINFRNYGKSIWNAKIKLISLLMTRRAHSNHQPPTGPARFWPKELSL